MDTPRFPAIAICPGDSFNVVEALPEGVSRAALDAGYLGRVYYFDSHGKRWRVARFEETSARPKALFGRLIGVRVSLAPPDEPPLSEVAEDLCALIDADPDDLYSQFATHEQLKHKFRSATTREELFALVSSLGADV